jgi:hypothetical protein
MLCFDSEAASHAFTAFGRLGVSFGEVSCLSKDFLEEIKEEKENQGGDGLAPAQEGGLKGKGQGQDQRQIHTGKEVQLRVRVRANVSVSAHLCCLNNIGSHGVS